MSKILNKHSITNQHLWEIERPEDREHSESLILCEFEHSVQVYRKIVKPWRQTEGIVLAWYAKDDPYNKMDSAQPYSIKTVYRRYE